MSGGRRFVTEAACGISNGFGVGIAIGGGGG